MMADSERAGVAYRNDDVHQADFHALRHTYLSRLGRSGASPKAMQRLVRHTTVQLTLGRYTHANLFDLKAAVDLLPPLSSPSTNEREAVKLQAAGTDHMSQSVLPFVLAPSLPRRDAKPLTFVHIPASSPDRPITREVTSNSVMMASAPLRNSHDISGKTASFSAKSSLIGSDSRTQQVACESFGSVLGSGDRPGLQTQCGD